MRRKTTKKDEIPKLRAREFKNIRENSGVSQQQFADFMGKRSKGTVWNWENERFMKPYQVKGLIDMVGRDVFNACRRMYADWQEQIKRDRERYVLKK